MPRGDGTGPTGAGPGTGRGRQLGVNRGRMGGPYAAGPGGECLCPACGHRVPARRRQPVQSAILPQVRCSHDTRLIKHCRIVTFYVKGSIMPRGDGTGPAGMGPMTGRAMGFCAGYGVGGYANPAAPGGFGFGRGMGRGFRGGGFGRGRGWGGFGAPYGTVPYGPAVPPTVTPEQQREALQAQAQNLQSALEDIKRRIDALEGDSKA